MKLGEPYRIEGDVRVSFRGQGKARFRLQHARDMNGQPDDLSWCDVSTLSGREKPWAQHGMEYTTLVDTVHGDVDLEYHRFKADWLRVVPHDDDEAEPCSQYSFNVSPIQSES